jgi:hypothetical protein
VELIKLSGKHRDGCPHVLNLRARATRRFSTNYRMGSSQEMRGSGVISASWTSVMNEGQSSATTRTLKLQRISS